MTRLLYTIMTLAIILLMGCGGGDPVLSTNDQFAIDIDLIDAYLAENGIDSALVDPSGIRYIINKEGTGIQPILSDVVRVNFVGRLLSTGAIFDSGNSADFRITGTIQAWQIMLPQMKEGSNYTIIVPSLLAYGFNGRIPSIPRNAVLIFDIELIRVGN